MRPSSRGASSSEADMSGAKEACSNAVKVKNHVDLRYA
jgi:hypothetical protein